MEIILSDPVTVYGAIYATILGAACTILKLYGG